MEGAAPNQPIAGRSRKYLRRRRVHLGGGFVDLFRRDTAQLRGGVLTPREHARVGSTAAALAAALHH